MSIDRILELEAEFPDAFEAAGLKTLAGELRLIAVGAIQENRRLKQSLVYLANCHAANAEIALKSKCPKYDRQRLLSIMEKCVTLLLGGSLPSESFQMDNTERTIDRLQDRIAAVKEVM